MKSSQRISAVRGAGSERAKHFRREEMRGVAEWPRGVRDSDMHEWRKGLDSEALRPQRSCVGKEAIQPSQPTPGSGT